MSGVVSFKAKRDVKGLIFDIEDPITRSEACCATLGKLIEYVGDNGDDHVRNVMHLVQCDLESALGQARKLHRELHAAVVPTTEVP